MNRCTRICAMNDPDKGCLLGLGDNCTVGPDKEYQRPAEVESGSVREKLVELLNEADDQCAKMACSNCGYVKNPVHCKSSRFADHLIANGVTVQEWIPVTERLPEEEGFALIWHDEIEISLFTEGKFCFYDSVGCLREYVDVTHWMPLPALPKGDSV